VSEWLLQNGVDTVYTRKAFDGKGPSYVFSNADVEVIITEDKRIDEIRPPSPHPSPLGGEGKGEGDT